MTLLDSARALVSSWSTQRANLESPQIPLSNATLLDFLGIGQQTAGVHVSERASFGLPAVYRAIALLSGSVAGLPLNAYRDRPDDTREKVRPRPPLLRAPHPDLTPFEWTELLLVHLLAWGNAYVRKLRDANGTVRELWLIEPSRVKAGRASDGHKVYEVSVSDLAGGIKGTGKNGTLAYTDEEILHIPGLGYDGTCGLSAIQAHRQGIGLAMAAERYGAKLFSSGSMLSGVLSTEQKINTAQADEIKARWKARHGGVDNAGEIAVIGGGTKFQPISIPPQDAQFIESRRFQVAEVARIFGVPPHLLMDTERSTSWGTGIEEQSTGFVVYTLRPWLIRVEQRLSRLLPAPQYAQFTVEGLLRGDTKTRYESYSIARQWGWLSVNDIRRYEELPPVENGDAYLEPLNMVPIGSDHTPKALPAPTKALPAPTTEEAPADA